MFGFTNKAKSTFGKIAKNADICIYGTSYVAQDILKNLKKTRPDINVKFFIETFTKTFDDIDGIPVYLADEAEEKCAMGVKCAIISSWQNRHSMELVLKSFGINEIYFVSFDFVKQVEMQPVKAFKYNDDKNLYKNLFECRKVKSFNSFLKKYRTAMRAKETKFGASLQYFEFINTDAIQTVFDIGGFDCYTSLVFSDRLSNCKNVYAFEPCYSNFKKTLYDKLIKKDGKITIVDKALWYKKDNLSFNMCTDFNTCSYLSGAHDRPDRKSEVINVDCVKFDDYVEQEKIQRVDFIKMDIENAEMQALMGAINTIKKHRPQLAISIYHTNKQFREIPLYLSEKLEDYEFRLGHYSDRFAETVLYAIPKELAK